MRQRSAAPSRPLSARLVGVVVAALALAPAVPAAADHQGARDVDEACSYAATSTFTDRPPGGAGAAVDCVAFHGVTAGATPTTYAPSVAVSRAQMAAFIVRTGEVAGITLPAPATDPFDDDDGSTHEGAIGRLADSGVASGFTDGTFRPLAEVTRGQMASFIARELRLVTGAPLPVAPSNHFRDDDGTTHEVAIDELAQLGVIAGTTETSYVPGAPVTRGQMALLLSRSLDWLTEARGAALARIDISDATESPELIGATSRTSGSVATVAFRFDEVLSATQIVRTSFSIVSFDGGHTGASSVARDAVDGAVVNATFPASLERLATTATVARNAVRDGTGDLSPEGAAPLRALELLPGTTSAPDLFSVSRLGASTVDFNFDEGAFVVDPTGYHLVLADGTALDSTAATGDGTTGHNVTFPSLTAIQSGRVVRGYVDVATVSDTAQTGGDPVEGEVNPQQAVTVSAGGSIAGVPDLTGVEVDAGADQVRFTFDEAVALPTNPGAASAFRAYDLDADEVAAERVAAAAGDGRTVVATFAAGTVGTFAAGASVDAAAVTSRATAATNRVDEEGVARTFRAGETAGPDLRRTGRVQQPGGDPLAPSIRRVVFEFDQPVVLGPAAGAFSVYAHGGARRALTGCAVTSGRFVTCSASSDDEDLYATIGAAAIAGIQRGAVLDAGLSHASHASADVL